MTLVVAPSVFVLVSCSGLQEARLLTRSLLEQELALCISIIDGAESHYRWRAALHCEREALLWIKTRADLADKAVRLLQQEHSYDMPSISVIKVDLVSQQTCAWIEAMGANADE